MAKIQTKPVKQYPDISDLLKAKEKQRFLNASRSFAEKIEVVKKLNGATQLWKSSKIINKIK